MADKSKTPTGTVEEREKKIAELQAEIDELRQPIPQEYPKWMYHPSEPPTKVENAAQEKTLGAGWVASTADFPGAKERAEARKGAEGPARVAHDVIKGKR